jgi:hypothetical protein
LPDSFEILFGKPEKREEEELAANYAKAGGRVKKVG